MNSPDMVIVDTEIIANAPVSSTFLILSIQARFLVAGMGDALATFVEARCARENPKVLPSHNMTHSQGESSVRVRPTYTE